MEYRADHYYAALEALKGHDDDASRADALAKIITPLVNNESARALAAEQMLDKVYQLIGSVMILLESAKAFDHLRRHAPEALCGTNWHPIEQNFIAEALADLVKAQELDNRIPF